jgi:hypothetical protein
MANRDDEIGVTGWVGESWCMHMKPEPKPQQRKQQHTQKQKQEHKP